MMSVYAITLSPFALCYTRAMGRWQPDALLRLRQAAMELFQERGYEGTTVEEIAQRAGLTQRTFFRYFADKREVLFAGTGEFETKIVEGVRDSTEIDPLARVVGAFDAVAKVYFDARTEAVRQRRLIIESSPELQEREVLKLGRVVSQVAVVLQSQGQDPSAAQFISELGMLVFRSSFAIWASGTTRETLAATIHATLERLRGIVSR